MSAIIDKCFLGEASGHGHTMINKLVPKSLGIFVWRAIRGRLPVRLELDKRGIDLDSVRCPVCDTTLESVELILLRCNLANDVWNLVRRWWNCNDSIVTTGLIPLFNLEKRHNWSHDGNMVWQAVRWVAGYCIWKYSNDKVFKNISKSSADIFNDIQVKSFEWVSKRAKNRSFMWHIWLLDPSFYGNSGLSRTGIG
ncbi:uncharacterized protein [Rutidosis leptorrhynchoides]|uniref:uncharacterized protein n=1 Tax=Rutidosis leptorrhynchoides TaxID=125765 RepID=UPI003A99EBFC